MKSSRWYPPFEIFMQPNSNLYYSILLWEYPSRSFRMHPATPSLAPWALAPCRLSAVMIEAHVTKLSVARVAPNIETMVCGDPQEGSGQNHHAPEHRWPEVATAWPSLQIHVSGIWLWHPWHIHDIMRLESFFRQAWTKQCTTNTNPHSKHTALCIYLYIFILYCPYSEIYLDIICNDLITLVPTKVQCEVSSCHWISYPSFKSHGWVPLPSKNLLPTSALNNSLHRHHKQCRSKGAWQLLPATQVRSWVGVTSERDAAYTRGQVDKRTRPGHKHRERASKIQ